MGTKTGMIANSIAPKTRAYSRRLFNIRALRASACAVFLTCGPIIDLGGVAPVSAQTQSAITGRNVFRFDIPAQPLDTALAKFGEVTGIQLVYDSGVSRTLRSNAVKGSMSSQAALSRMLASTGLSPRYTGERTVTLSRGSGGNALAQAPASGAVMLDPIVVEAEKVMRDYFRTYTSVGVVTSQEIANYNVQDLRQSFELLGNVRAFPASRGNSGFVVRGVSSEGLTQPTRSAPIIAVVIDGAIQNGEATRRGARGVWDVEQIEVLRGPQSTLQGQHALGGAVLIKTKDPTYTPEAIVEAQGGTHDFRTAAFAVNAPIVPNEVAVRVSGQVMRESKGISYLDPLVAPLGQDEFEQVRAKLLVTPQSVPGLTGLFTVSRTFDKPAVTAVTGPDFFARQFNVTASSGSVDFRKTYTNNYISDISYELAPGLKLKSLTAFAETDTTIGSPAGSSLVRNDKREGGDFSQDLRVAFDPAGSPLTGVAGLFAGRFSNRTDSLITTTLFGPSLSLQDLKSDNTTSSIAAYTDLRYRFFDRWTLIAGGRLLQDKVRNDVRGEAFDTQFFTQASLAENVSNTNTEFLPKGGLAYDLTDNQTVAGTATKGYRSGFAEAVIGSGTINRVAPEYLWSYELAYRSRWLEDRLQVNANTFYYDYRDQQLVVDNPFIVGASTTANVDKSHAYGAEIDVRWKPIQGLTIFSSIGLLKTRFDDAVTSLGTINGNAFPNSPTITASAGAFYKHESGFFVGADISYTDGFYSSGDVRNTPTRFVDAYTLVNARIGYETQHGSVSLFARNLLDEKYLTSITAGRTEATIGDSRMIGIKATARF